MLPATLAKQHESWSAISFPRRAGVRRPPADSVGLLLDEVGEYLPFERSPVRQFDADGGPCVRLRRLHGFRIEFIQAGEVGGSHESSVASGGADGQQA